MTVKNDNTKRNKGNNEIKRNEEFKSSESVESPRSKHIDELSQYKIEISELRKENEKLKSEREYLKAIMNCENVPGSERNSDFEKENEPLKKETTDAEQLSKNKSEIAEIKLYMLKAALNKDYNDLKNSPIKLRRPVVSLHQGQNKAIKITHELLQENDQRSNRDPNHRSKRIILYRKK